MAFVALDDRRVLCANTFKARWHSTLQNTSQCTLYCITLVVTCIGQLVLVKILTSKCVVQLVDVLAYTRQTNCLGLLHGRCFTGQLLRHKVGILRHILLREFDCVFFFDVADYIKCRQYIVRATVVGQVCSFEHRQKHGSRCATIFQVVCSIYFCELLFLFISTITTAEVQVSHRRLHCWSSDHIDVEVATINFAK